MTEQAVASGEIPLITVGNTPEGILVGIDAPDSPPTPDTTTTTPDRPGMDAKYTEEDLRRVREQEKSKLYSRLDKMSEQVDLLRREQEAREALLRAETETEELSARKREEQEMDLRELLAKKEAEWQQRLDALEEERQKDRALLEQERRYSELTEYANRRMQEEQDNILPELLDLVSGSTPEEIEASIKSLRERSDRIFESAQQAMSSARRDMSGARVTMPSAMENPSENSMATPEDIQAMSMQEYAKHRQRLLSQQAQGRSRGLFG